MIFYFSLEFKTTTFTVKLKKKSFLITKKKIDFDNKIIFLKFFLFQMNQQCKVCGEPAAGFHFGAFTCEGCKVRKVYYFMISFFEKEKNQF